MSDIKYSNCESDCEQENACDCDCRWCCQCEERPRPVKPNRTLLKCGCPGSVTLPLASLAGASFNLASVNVDTRGFKKPCIKFEFASNIETTAAILSLNFQIFKTCKNQLIPIPVGPIWSFSRLVAITASDTFTFFVCDCDECNEDCCNYSVTATIAGVATVGVTSITNATLSAIVVDNTDCR